MKKIALTALAAAALVASAGSAAAAPYNYGNAYGHRWQSINERQAQLDQRIDRGVRNGSLTRHEAQQLRDEFHDIARLEARYRQNGLTAWERNNLDGRFDRLSAQIARQTHDDQTRYGGYRR